MKRMMVQYRVRADQAAANARYVVAVFTQLAERQPPGLRYASFKIDDGVSFVHIVSQETDSGNPLAELPAFKAFTAAIAERCDEVPVVTKLNEVGSYRIFGD